MPTRARSFGRFVFGSLTLMPSTTLLPSWNGSSALTTLISVDLPDPDGPQTTITSPFSTLVVQLVSTWKLPYHLETSLISIIGMAFRSLTDDGNLLLQYLHDVRQREAHEEIDERREQVHFNEATVALRDLRRRAEKVGDRKHVHERRVLKQNDRLREQNRNHVAERLRQNNLRHRLPVIRRLEQRERDHRRRDGADLDRRRRSDDPRADVRHQEVEPEDDEQQRNRPHQVDIARCRQRQPFVRRKPHHREQRSEDDAAK